MASSITYASSSDPLVADTISPQPAYRPFSDSIVNTTSSSENLVPDPAEHDDCKPLPDELSSTKRGATGLRRRREKDNSRRSRRPKAPGQWKKILWVKQSYPDNYTDPPTFLSRLQRNPKIVPYEFWPLVADSTVIVQHVCSVAIFICCFVGIYQGRVSPISVVGWGTSCTFLGWLVWDMWIGQDERSRKRPESAHRSTPENRHAEDASSATSKQTSEGLSDLTHHNGLGISTSTTSSTCPSRVHSRNISATSLHIAASSSSVAAPMVIGNSSNSLPFSSYTYVAPFNAPASMLSPRNQQRLATAKSAILIYCALLGLSPILKSLTISTSSDSIWAMSTWLMLMNVFFFDYGSDVSVKYPSSLSTNAALMASTVLASRLASTTHVFSLTLFSIEVFGLFPVFRRHLRHRSWQLHVMLTVMLILIAGAALGATVVQGGRWKASIAGTLLWGLGNILAMGGCSWWLIGLQKYKNVVTGPWDPAKPVIRGTWD